ncbi:MAG: Ig family protein [Parcubacteria group bacterium GW2011_GWA2_47_8b]|nr:MAG: Ig family protein [Parcubacteria group bacterium GW2011_GWA2_47_8b]
MKKAVIFVVLTAIVIGNFALANKAEAISIAKRIECVFHPSHCSNSSSSSSPAPESSAPAADVNHSPVWATNQTYFYIKTGQLLQFTLSATDPDNDTLVYGVSFVPSGANFGAYNHTFSWTPNDYQQGNYYMQFSVTDGEYRSYLTVTINVTEATNSNSNSNNDNRRPVCRSQWSTGHRHHS